MNSKVCPARSLAIFGVVLGAALLILRMTLTVVERMQAGDGLLEALVFYFSFFTILTNIGLVLVYASELTGRLAWFRRQWVRSMLAALILLVMTAYHFLIAGNFEREGLVRIADFGTHYLTPPLYLAWWVVAERREVPSYADLGRMLLPPAAYLVYMLLRGLVTGFFPYGFLSPSELGPGAAALNIAGFAVGTAALFAVAILCDRLLAGRAAAR